MLSKFFSNLEIKGSFVPPKNAITRWEVTNFKLREPYAGFYKNGNFDTGRSKANNVEPIFAGILNTLNETWDTVKYERNTAPVMATIDDSESANQISGKIYTY